MILAVPPGTYTVEAKRVGYTPFQFTNVQVGIDITRTLNFSISSAAATLTAVSVVAPPVPLVEDDGSSPV